MIRYDRLWDTMANRGMTQYKLIKFHGFSAGQIGRLKKNMHVSTHTLETLCRLLDCRVEDIVEYVADGPTTVPKNTICQDSAPSDSRIHTDISTAQTPADITVVQTVSRKDQPPTAASGDPASSDGSDSRIQPPLSGSKATSKAEKTKKGSKTKKASKKSLKNAKKSRKK